MVGLIVHEWIEPRGGSENVLDSMAATFPEADLFCLWNNAPDRFKDRSVAESWISRTPLRRSKAAALPAMPSTWRAKDVSAYDWVLVSSHLFAHHVGGRVRSDGPQKFVYVHTPARYIWKPDLDHRGQHPVAKLASPSLRKFDRSRAAQGALFAANSRYIRDRIREAWDQDAAVIYPPVRVEYLMATPRWRDVLGAEDAAIFDSLPKEFILGASRYVSYKRLDVVIAAGEAAGVPVVLAGSGPERNNLTQIGFEASVPVILIEKPSDALLFALYQEALLFVFLAVEDFGIMPVEAIALGTPTLVYEEGGARESVEVLGGGAVISDFGPQSLRRGVDDAVRMHDPGAAEKALSLFSETTFALNLKNWMKES